MTADASQRAASPDPWPLPAPSSYGRCNLFALPLTPEIAHGGSGSVNAVRITGRDALAGGCNFIDYAELPPGATVGDHRHAIDEEEFYLVLAGAGVMRIDADTFPVTAGDLVRNPPGSLHGLCNTGTDLLRLFIFELAVPKGVRAR